MSGRGGRDKGKRNKHGGRTGGHRSYIANVEELEKREREQGGDDEDDSEEESDEEEVAPASGGETVFEFRSKAERDAMKKTTPEETGGGGKKVASNNPNHAKKGSSGIKVSDMSLTEAADPTAGMNRKEREAFEAEKAKEDYMKKHLAGETEQARKDMERLAIVRKRREDQAAKRAVTGRKPGMSKTGLDDEGDSSDDEPPPPVELSEAAAAKKAAALATVDDTDPGSAELEILKAIDIKKMNGDALKEALKARGLGTQGAKKDLIGRLTDYEKKRAEGK